MENTQKQLTAMYDMCLQWAQDQGWEILPEEKAGEFVVQNGLQLLEYPYSYEMYFIVAMRMFDKKMVVIRIMYEDGNTKTYTDQSGIINQINPKYSGAVASAFVFGEEVSITKTYALAGINGLFLAIE